MSRSYHTSPAKLRFKKGCPEVYLVDETGKEELLSNKHVLRSKVITDVASWGPGGCTPLPISIDLMRVWVSCIDSGLRTVTSCETLAQLLQARFFVVSCWPSMSDSKCAVGFMNKAARSNCPHAVGSIVHSFVYPSACLL